MCADSASSRLRISFELYVLIDEGLVGLGNLQRTLEQALRGGADAVQFRAKRLSKRQYYRQALALFPIAKSHKVPFFINDHLDIALAISADGIHLGQNDLPADAARRLTPQQMLLGVSTHSEEQAVKALRDGADYVAIGAVFDTSTKERPEAVVGTDGVRRVKALVGPVPLIAIGGIGIDNVVEVVRAGADGVAVASAVVLADDPCLAAKQLKDKIRSEGEHKGRASHS